MSYSYAMEVPQIDQWKVKHFEDLTIKQCTDLVDYFDNMIKNHYMLILNHVLDCVHTHRTIRGG
jgi:L-fucose isomerase-like protein